MNLHVFISLLFILMLSGKSLSQDLNAHRWQDRLIVLIASDIENPTYQAQLQELLAKQAGMKERKLLIYHLFPNEVFLGTNTKTKIWDAKHLYQRFHKGDAPFEILLIGLDGGIKLRKRNFVNVEDLFALIDGMPMRRAEMNRN